MSSHDGDAGSGKALDTQEFEARLRQRYRLLWQDVQREIEKQRGEQFPDLVDGGGTDLEDLSVADLIVDLDIAEIDRDVGEMRAIQDAIGRIRAGTYGICGECGEPIAPDRLEAAPEARLCFECQARKERSRENAPSL